MLEIKQHSKVLCTEDKCVDYCVTFPIIGTSERNIWTTSGHGVEMENYWEMHAILWTRDKGF